MVGSTPGFGEELSSREDRAAASPEENTIQGAVHAMQQENGPILITDANQRTRFKGCYSSISWPDLGLGFHIKK